MTDEQALAFLAEGAPTGKLATAAADGSRVHVVPIWFLVGDGEIVFTTGERTLKGRNLRENPRAALSVDDERPPFSYVEVRGAATIEDAAPDLLDWPRGSPRAPWARRRAAPTAGATPSPASCWCACGSTASAAGPAWPTEERA